MNISEWFAELADTLFPERELLEEEGKRPSGKRMSQESRTRVQLILFSQRM